MDYASGVYVTEQSPVMLHKGSAGFGAMITSSDVLYKETIMCACGNVSAEHPDA